MRRRIIRWGMSVVSLFVALGFWLPQPARGQTALFRLTSEFRRFDGTHDSTTLGIPGISVYKKTLFVGANTVYITVDAVGDVRNGSDSLALLCTIDGAPCNSGTDDLVTSDTGTTHPGWILVFEDDNSAWNQESNVIHYQWCTTIAPGSHTIQIKMASTTPAAGDGVFLRAENFYIDTSSLVNGCRQGSN